MLPGFAFAADTSCCTVLMFFSVAVTSTRGTLPSGVIPAKSRTGS
jgi:hypothetical protein